MIKFPEKSSIPTDFSGEIDSKGSIGYFPGCIDFLDSFLEVMNSGRGIRRFLRNLRIIILKQSGRVVLKH
jgi:hypothetical protein